MINTAFASPDRTLTARITINGTVYGPDVISKIEFKRGVSLADQFQIGTAYSQVISFDILDEFQTLFTGLSLGGTRAKVELGILDGATVVYKDMGSYILDSPEHVEKMLWSFTGVDDMDKAKVLFADGQTYPRTISQIFQYAVAQIGMTTDTTTFPNSAVSITTKPTWYDMTIREVLADIAEIAAAYCFVEDGKIRIKSIVQDTTTSVTSNNIKEFRRTEQLEKDIKINKLVIMQQGASDHTTGTGVNPYFIKDNVFIQGNPSTFSAAIYTALNGIQFTPGEVEFNGNPTEILNGWVNLEFLGKTYKFFATSREITFNGGMSEKWISNFLDNLPHKEEVKDLVRTIKKTSARLLVLDNEITAKVEDVVGDAPIYTWIKYADDAIGNGLSNDPAGKKYLGLATGKTTQVESTEKSDYTWSKIEGPQGPQGNQGIQGPVGSSLYTWVKYATTPTTGMADLPAGKLYIGLAYNKTTPTESSTYNDYEWSLIKGDKGDQGVIGPKGPDGATLYTWIKYADTKTSGMSDDPTGKKYMGIAYNKPVITESSNYGDYDWSLIEGPQGVQGVIGPKGADGATLYTWVKYGTTAAGGTISDDPAGKAYIGLAYNKTTATESNVPGDYSWSLIKGTDGTPGGTGPTGATLYTWVKYASTPTTGMADDPTGKLYIGIAYNKTTATKSTNYGDYSWTLIKGQSVTSISEQYYQSTSASTQTGGSWLDVAPTHIAGRFIWTRLKTIWTDPVETTYSTPVLSSTWASINGALTRLDSAEFKILPDQIKSTVEERITANGSLVLATKSDIVQTKSEWVATFGQIGGANLIRNSGFENGISEWIPNSTGLTLSNNDSSWVGRNFSIIPSTTVTSRGAYRPISGLIVGQKYTLSGMIWTYQKAMLSVYGMGTATTTKIQEWEHVKVTFTATATSGNILALIQDSAMVAGMWIDSIKLELGEVATDWTPHPDELYTGITTIDKDGISIGKSNETVETHIANDGLRIKDGSVEVASFTESGAVISDLQADTITGNVLNTINSSMTLTVGSGYTFPTVAQAINSLGNRRIIASGVNLSININSIINEEIYINNFSGSGKLTINISAKINGFIRTTGNSCLLEIIGYAGNSITYDGTTYRSATDRFVRFINVNTNSINKDPNSSGILFELGSNGTVTGCDVSNAYYGIVAQTGARVTTYNNRGTVTGYGSYGGSGGIMYCRGTIPKGTVANTIGTVEGFLYTESNTPTNSTYSPPAATQKTFTGTFAHSNIYTYSLQYSAPSTYYGASGAQNRWDTSTGQFKAKITFSSEVYNFIADRDGGTTPDVQIRLRRKNSTHGTSDSVAAAPDWAGAPSFGGATRGNFTPWVSIPYTLIGSGGYTFSFGTGTTGNTYAIWDYAEIWVSKKKTV